MGSIDKKPLRVLISGAGIAGPAVAFWLSRLGHSCTIIERSPELRSNGQQIDIRKQGVEAAERMGILEDIRKLAVDEAGLQFVDAKGKSFATFPKIELKPGDDKGQQGFTSEFEIMRGDLCKLLFDKTKDSTKYMFGKFVTEFHNEPDCVNVTFSDDTKATYDLVVAADGQSSRIRKMLLKDEDPSADYSRDLGVYLAFFTIDRQPGDTNMATVHVSTGERVVFSRFHSETQGQGYFGTMARADEIKEVLKQDVDKQKALFADIFRGAGAQSDRLVDAMFKAKDFYAQSSTQIRTKVWHKGRVVCVGDAGYGPTSLTGMGTSLALMGATMLAGEIAQYPHNPEEAFASYEKKFRPYVEKVQQIPRGVPGLVYPRKEWGVKIIRFLLTATATLGLDKAAQLSFLSKDPWKLPQYPQLQTQA